MTSGITVIIPTYNGAHRLPAVLSALSKQTAQGFHVVVAIDGSTDGTQETIDSLKEKPDNLTYCFQENKGRAAIRNHGASKAKTDHLLFIDDDIVLDERALEELICIANKKPKDSLITGVCNLIPDENHSLIDKYRLSNEAWANSLFKEEDSISPEHYRFTSQLLFISKACFLELGGFDERLNDSEDLDLSIVAMKQNKGLFFSKNVKSGHLDSRSLEQLILRRVQYWKGRDILAELKPDYQEMMPEHFFPFDLSWRKKIFLPVFQYGALWQSFFNSSLTSIFPNRLIFFLLEKVIYATTFKRARS